MQERVSYRLLIRRGDAFEEFPGRWSRAAAARAQVAGAVRWAAQSRPLDGIYLEATPVLAECWVCVQHWDAAVVRRILAQCNLSFPAPAASSLTPSTIAAAAQTSVEKELAPLSPVPPRPAPVGRRGGRLRAAARPLYRPLRGPALGSVSILASVLWTIFWCQVEGRPADLSRVLREASEHLHQMPFDAADLRPLPPTLGLQWAGSIRGGAALPPPARTPLPLPAHRATR